MLEGKAAKILAALENLRPIQNLQDLYKVAVTNDCCKQAKLS